MAPGVTVLPARAPASSSNQPARRHSSKEMMMTIKHIIEKMAEIRKIPVRDFFEEAYRRYYAGEIPEDELVKDCKAFHDHWTIPEYVEDYVASIYGLL